MPRHVSPSLTLLAALAMGGPSIAGALQGSVSIDALCVRLVLAVLVSYVGLRGLNRLIAGYAAPPPKAVEAPEPETQAA